MAGKPKRQKYLPGVYRLVKELAQNGLERTPAEVDELAAKYKCSKCGFEYVVLVGRKGTLTGHPDPQTCQMCGTPNTRLVK